MLFRRRTCVLLKKSGKPLEMPDYKQAYLPYEKAPTDREIQAANAAFQNCPDWQSGYTKKLRVLEVPQNLYTYGKEGMTVPISIFKDQDDPVIGPEHTYPGIYELKIALRHHTLGEYMDMAENETFQSPMQKEAMYDMLDEKERIVDARMRWMSARSFRTKYSRDRAAGAGGAKTVKSATPTKGGDPDTAAAAPATPAAGGKK